MLREACSTLLGVKRPLDLDGLHDALPSTCSGVAHIISAQDATGDLAMHKRTRFEHSCSMAASSVSASAPFGTGVRDTPFPVAQPLDCEDLESIISSLQSPIKRPNGEGGPPTYEGKEKEKKYSFEDVRAIINKVVGQKEASIRAEYDRILQAKLAEQFQSFTKFNQDYISRQIKGNPFSYVS